jgi:hypothetical protein
MLNFANLSFSTGLRLLHHPTALDNNGHTAGCIDPSRAIAAEVDGPAAFSFLKPEVAGNG